MGVQMQIASLALGVMAAQRQRSAYEMEAQAYEEEAKMAEIQAKQEENERTNLLQRQLASLSASMAAQGVSVDEQGSVGALTENERNLALADISSIRLMGSSKTRKYSLSAAGSRAAGQGVVLGSMAKTATGIYDIQTGGGVVT